MRIAIDGHMLGDHSGGNESYYSNLLRAMRPDPKDEVFLFVKPNTDIAEYKGKFQIVEFKSKSPFLRNYVELDKLCRRHKIDLLHTQYFIPFKRSCKVVCTIHDICFEHYRDIFTKKEYIRQKILIPYAAKHAEYIFTVSNHSKDDIADHYKINPQKVIVTYNAVNESFRKLDKEELDIAGLRQKFDIGEGAYVLTVGNLQPRKNLPRLIEAFNNWKRKNENNVRLVIVGKKAWLYSDIQKKVRMESKDIVLTDYVSEEDLIRLYNGAGAFIYPSFFEGFGIPPLEAMACGVPVAVANTTSLPEVVGEAGLYFDPYETDEIEEAINTLMTLKDVRETLIEKGFEQRNKFDWRKSSEIVYQTYDRIRTEPME